MFKKRVATAVVVSMVFGLMLAGHTQAAKGGKPPKDPPTPPPPLTNPAFVYVAEDDTRPAPFQQLFLTTADGSATEQLTFGGHKHAIPEWSPDGARVAYARSQDGEVQPWCGGIYARNSDGSGEETLLLDFCDEEYPLYLWPTTSRLSWSADDRILVGAQGYAGLDPGIYVLDVATGAVSNIVPSLTPGVLDRAIQATWSPDLDAAAPGYQGEIAVCGGNYVAGGGFVETGILILDPETGAVKRTIPGTAAYGCDEGGTAIDWSPNGAWLVYNMHGDEAPWLLIKSRADGSGEPVVLTECMHPNGRWSPSSARISYSERVPVRNKLQRDVFYINADGTGLTNVTQTEKQDEWNADWNPVWDPEG